MKKILLLLLIFLVIPLAHSIGLGGEFLRDTIIFEPHLEKTYTYAVIPNAPNAMDYRISVSGDLKEYVTLSDTIFEKLQPGEMGIFTATLKLPADLEPGQYKLQIGATESTTRTGGQIGGKTSAKATITVRSLDYNKRIKVKLTAEEVEEFKPIPIKLLVENWGREDIASVSADIELHDFEELLGETSTETASIESGKSVKLNAVYEPGLSAGSYIAKAIIAFDEESITMEDEFRIGTLLVEIANYTNPLYTNEKNVLTLNLQSSWNKEVKEVYADVNVNGETLKTTLTDIPPFSTSDIVTYWDTDGLKEGDYEAKVTLYYEDQQSNETIQLSLVPKPFFLGAAIAIPGAASLLLVLLVVIAMLLIAHHYYKKNNSRPVKYYDHRKRKNKDEPVEKPKKENEI
jgi:hypothetical protein